MEKKSKETWHFPRRADLDEFTETIRLLKKKEFRNKLFNPHKQERLASLLDQKNITKSVHGRISPSSVRTLVANIDYFFPVKEGKKIKISKVADKLLNSRNRKSVFETQMLKLQITNPKIERSCKNVKVFPYQVILKLLLKLNELTFEEIGYFLLRYKGNRSLAELKENIEEFRKNPDKDKIIEDYKSTAEGKWALLPSAMANYVMNFCETTGTCKIIKENDVKRLKLNVHPKNVKKKLSRFSSSPFNFESEKVFNIYMGDPKITMPPKVSDMEITDEKRNPASGTIVKIIREFENALKVVDEEGHISVKLFPERTYKYEIYDANGNQVDEGTIKPLLRELSISVSLTPSEKLDKEKIVKMIDQLVSSSHYDEILKSRLDALKKVTKYRVRSKKRLRGGRLEQLFYLLFKRFKDEKNLIDRLVWNGRLDERRIPNPAPGSKPDLIVEIDEKVFVLEVTLIGDKRSQWEKEGASVPDHVEETKKEFGKDVIGIFIAPRMHEANEKNLKCIAECRGIQIGFKKIGTLVGDLVSISSKEDLKSTLSSSLKQ